MKRPQAAREPSFLDDGCVPRRIASDAQIRAARLDVRALWVLSYIDGASLLSDVFARAGLPLEEARAGVNDLVRRGIVSLRPPEAAEVEGVWNGRAR